MRLFCAVNKAEDGLVKSVFKQVVRASALLALGLPAAYLAGEAAAARADAPGIAAAMGITSADGTVRTQAGYA